MLTAERAKEKCVRVVWSNGPLSAERMEKSEEGGGWFNPDNTAFVFGLYDKYTGYVKTKDEGEAVTVKLYIWSLKLLTNQ